MFTLQILDRGQTFLYSPPPDQPVILGSDERSDLRLAEEGIAARHARLEPAADGLRLVGLEAVRVNGAQIDSVMLQLGDRIEIGRSVLVVGRSVSRAASPEDVLDLPRPRAGRQRQTRRSRLPIVIGILIVAGLGTLAYYNRGDEQAVRGQFALIEKARDQGDLGLARTRIAASRREWQGAEDDRLQRLAAVEAEVEAIDVSIRELEARVLDPTSGPYAVWIRELRRLEEGSEPAVRMAARIVRSTLREKLLQRPPEPAEVAPPAVAETPSPNQPSAVAVTPEVVAAGQDLVAAAIADADRLASQGLFAQAIAVLEAEIGQVGGEAEVARVESRLASLRAEAVTAAATIVSEANLLVDAGKPRDAVTMLTLAQHRFPGSGDSSVIGQARRRIEQAMAVGMARQPDRVAVVEGGSAADPGPAAHGDAPAAGVGDDGSSFSALRTKLDRIRDLEAIGDHAAAAGMLREAADLARSKDAGFAARLEARAEQASRSAALHDRVAAELRSGRLLRTMLRSGTEATLAAVDGCRFTTVGDAGKVTWPELSAAGIAALLEQVGVAGPAALGAATMIYGSGDSALAEDLLAKALRADAGLKSDIDRVIACGRGERFDERGYLLGKGGFVSVRSVELGKEADKVQGKIAAAFKNRDPEVRDQFVTDLLARGPDMLEVAAMAFDQDLGQLVAKLEGSQLRRQVERLAEHRVALDAARKHAKDLIYDEVKYFYPYKPPAVPSDRFAEYNRVQAEVNNRIDALRAVWKDTRSGIKVPPSLRTDLEHVDWDLAVLTQLGSGASRDLTGIEWARALPPGSTVTIADFCLSVAERDELEEWRRIEAWNNVVQRELSSSVRELLRITNEYRAMYRHRPLAISVVVCSAAQGHAEEMSRLGYFAHMSPTPGRRTPFDRMKLAGYGYGVSENIATNGSALGAHYAWLGSSGHHRNLLSPRHREIGIGADGHNWVQNFGSGTTYLEDPAWQQLRDKPRSRGRSPR
ncbi:MAG: hypothetical protein KDC98_20075 [Planctomycetes bacterium]|nr:hypothetical protein [Planctomycetota bacterium]